MKKQKKEIRETEQGRGGSSRFRSSHLRSERGVVLVMVIVLSAVALAVMTVLIVMLTSGVQVSGRQKRFTTALEAGVGGSEIFYQLMPLRGELSKMNAFQADVISLTPSLPTPLLCTGQNAGGTPYSGLAAKLLTPSTSWGGSCANSLRIDPADPTTYDMRIALGTDKKYDVYAKVVATVEGNSGGNSEWSNRGVENQKGARGGGGGGSIAVVSKPYLYSLQVLSEYTAQSDERAKLSIEYQY